MNKDDVIEVDPEKLSGTPIFRGARAPIKNFFDYFESRERLKNSLTSF